MFETNRLRLRAREKADIEKLRALWNQREVHRSLWIEHVVPMGPEFEEKLATWSNESLFYAIIERKVDNAFLGYMNLYGLKEKNRDASLGIALLPQFWGQGYATEAARFLVDYAFEELALHRVTLDVFGSNEAAIEAYKKAGFVQEGVIRKANWSGGQWEDIVCMGILEEDWADVGRDSG